MKTLAEIKYEQATAALAAHPEDYFLLREQIAAMGVYMMERKMAGVPVVHEHTFDGTPCV